MTALLGKGRRGWFHDLKAATGNWDPTADREVFSNEENTLRVDSVQAYDASPGVKVC